MRSSKTNSNLPLAEKLRPQSLSDIVGQSELLADDGVIIKMLNEGVLRSMILWGPPGVGKTTLARLLAQTINADLLEFSGARAQIKELRDAVDNWVNSHQSKKSEDDDLFSLGNKNLSLSEKVSQKNDQKKLVVFVDEIHRYNKAQQDYFLPVVEQGVFILIGATTENPGFEINNALLSRMVVMLLQSLSTEDLRTLILRGQKFLNWEDSLEESTIDELINNADGDGRRLINDIEALYFNSQEQRKVNKKISADELKKIFGQRLRRFDKGGDIFYDQISALHKAVRGSDANAALYWFVRMIDGGCDPLYIARRMIRMASEDIGLADPQALTLAISATNAYERLGAPEGILSIAQVIVYLSLLPKSNALYVAFNQAKEFVATDKSREVPLNIRNAPTKVQKELGAGKNYRYAHDEPNGYAAGENYWPPGLEPQKWYQPTERGLENKIRERMKILQELDKEYWQNIKK